jgi:hypothetical protein
VQYVAYEIICATFLLNIVEEKWQKCSINHTFGANDEDRANTQIIDAKKAIKESLEKMGAKPQLIMFVTGPAGAGKSTAINVAQRFCFEFCRALGLPWDKNTFLFTAITGCAAALFDGTTLHSAAFLNSKESSVTPAMINQWRNVKLLIVDEISFSTTDQMKNLNNKLNMIRRRIGIPDYIEASDMVYGGYSVIFSGDFRQIPPVKCPDSKLLYKNEGLWENSINVAIFLNNSHRFKDDPEFGRRLNKMWRGKFTQEDCDYINQRLLGRGTNVQLPSLSAEDDIAYACHTNAEKTAIHATSFQKHIAEFPSIDSSDLPPSHTVIIEADITRAPARRPRKKDREDTNIIFCPPVTKRNSEKIYSKCSDSDMRDGTKFIDPALKLYIGVHCMINDNEDIASGRGNGTLCRLVSIKLKENTILNWRNYENKKVYAVNARGVEYLEFEHFPKKIELLKMEQQLEEIMANQMSSPHNLEIASHAEQLRNKIDKHIKSRRFKLYSKKYYCTFDSDLVTSEDTGLPRVSVTRKKKQLMKVGLEQFSVNLNDATTAHKLQGCSKNNLIVKDWFYSHGWVYTVLSRVRTLSGLFLMKPLVFRQEKFETPKALEWFDYRMKEKIPTKAKLAMNENQF